MRLTLLTTVTMIAFAANSVLARLALGDGAIDAASYSAIRLAFGALVLTALASNFHGDLPWKAPFHTKSWEVIEKGGNIWSAGALVLYVVGFSYAYLALDTGTGALILFAVVQAVMIGWGIYRGNRPSVLEWLGLVVAFGAFVALVAPGLTAPEPFAACIMALAGIGWAIYSLRGSGAQAPLLETAGNFIRGTMMMLVLFFIVWVFARQTLNITWLGLSYAALSGGLTSGVGYALWYYCLKQLTTTRAAIVQLTVPAIAAGGGVVFLQEELTMRLVVCAVLILGGVALAISVRAKPNGAKDA